MDLIEKWSKTLWGKTNIVLSTSYVQKDSQSLMIYRYVHLSLPVNLSANIIINFRKPQDKLLSNSYINHTILENP